MSNTVDRRVVEMEFDNREFEKNVGTSLKSIGSLKESLKLEDSAKELKALEKAGRRFNLDGIAEAAEMVTSKFSIMGTIGDQVIRRLTDSVLNVIYKMKNVVNSLTIEPIYSGFQEYETQINAIQTILSNTREELTNKGYDDAQRLELVNSRLDQLNHYADKTIYNFTEMTRNIGTFTAAGVELDTAVNSIQGIANLAAVSGSTSDQASRAMYQLSQAISTGTLRLMDWNSVVNAGMGGKVFQDALVRTAKAMNKTVDVTVTKTSAAGKKIRSIEKRTVDELIKEAGSFPKSLSEGWLTADVLTATLEQFSWDFEQIAEDTILNDENRESWIKRLAEMYVGDGRDADAALEKARKMLEEMSDLTAEEVKEIKKAELLASGYTSDEADEIIKLAEDANEAATKVKTFTQLFDTLKEAAQSGWTQTWEYIIGDFEEAKSTLTGISKFFGAIIDSSSEARNSIVKEWHDKGGRDMLWNDDAEKGPLGAFWNLVLGIKNMISAVREEFQKIFPPATSKTLLNITQGVQEVTARFREWTEDSKGMDIIRRIVAGIAAALGLVRDAVSYVWKGFLNLIGAGNSAFDGLLEFFAGIGDWIVKTKESIKTSKTFQKFLSKMSLAITAVRNAVVSAAKVVFSWITKLWDKIAGSEVLSKVGEHIVNFVGYIPTAISTVKEWAKGVIDSVKASDKLKEAWAKVKKFFEPAVTSVKSFGERMKTAISDFFNIDTSEDGNFFSRLIENLSGGTWYEDVKEKLTIAWENVKNFFSELFTKKIPEFFNKDEDGTGSLANKIKGLNWKKIIPIALGVGSLVGVLALIGKIVSIVYNISQIGKIGTAFKTLTKTGGEMQATWKGIRMTANGKTPISQALLKIAAAIGVMVASVVVLSKMNAGDVIKGVGLLTLLAAELIGISALFGKINVNGGSILKAAAAVLVLVLPIKLLAAMKLESALKGMVLLGLIFAELAMFTRMMGTFSKDNKTVGFFGLSIAINLLVLAVKGLGNMNLGSLVKGLGGLEILFLEMSAFSQQVSGKKVSGIIGLAIGVALMAHSIKKIGNMKTGTIAKGLVGLGGIMLAFGAMLKLSKGLNVGSALVLLLTMAGSLILITEAFNRIDTDNPDKMLKFAESFAAIMLSMSVSMMLLSKIPITGSLAAVANFAIFIAGLGGIIVGLGWLQSKWAGLTDFLEGGGNILGQIGRAIGKFVGGIAGGIVEGLDLPQIGTDLSQFMTNSAGFIEGARSIDGSVVTGVGNLCAALLAIGGTEVITALITLFTGNNPVVKFVTELKILGAGLAEYAGSIQGLSSTANSGDSGAAIAIATNISELSKKLDPDTVGGWMVVLFGKKTAFERFSEAIGPFGEAMKSFAESVGGFTNTVSDDTLTSVIAAARGIETVAKNAPDQPTIEKILGLPDDFSIFVKNIEGFGNAMQAYALAVSGLTIDDGTQASVIAAATGIEEIANNAPTQPTIEKILGLPDDFSIFNRNIVGFGTAMSTYAMLVSRFDKVLSVENQASVIAAAKGIEEIANNAPTQSIIEKILGLPSNFAVFNKNIVGFGTAMSAYAVLVSRFDKILSAENQASVIAAAKGIEEIANNVPTQPAIEKILGLPSNFAVFNKNIVGFGTAMSAYAVLVSRFNKNLSAENQASVIAAAKGIEEIGNNVPTQPTVEKILGLPDDFSIFNKNIEGFGTAMSAYAALVSRFNKTVSAENQAAVMSAAQGILDISRKVPTQSTINKILGLPDDFSVFNTNIKAFATAMEAYASMASGFSTDITSDDNTAVLNAAQGLVDFANTFDPSGSVWNTLDKVFGKGSKIATLEEYTGSIRKLGEDLGSFTAATADVDTLTGQDAIDMVESMRQFVDGLESSGDVWDWFAEHLGSGSKFTTLETLTGQMADLGDKLKAFSSGAATANLASKNFEKVKDIILDIKAFNETINENGEISTANMYRLLGVIETAGVSLETMSNSLSGISSVDDLAKAAGVIRDFAYAFEVAGTMSNFDSNPIQTIVDSVSQIMIPKFDEGGIESAQAYISSLLTSIEDASTLLSLTTAITALSSAGSSAADGTYNVWYTSGQYLAAGLGAGISSMADSVKTSATTVASGAIQSIRIAWSIQSPSKVGQELGMYFDMGIAGGLSEYSRIVSDRASEVGMSAVDSASMLLRGVDGSIFDNLDPNPTIRPVVDLTEVQNGVNSINTMFGANRVLSSDLFRGVNSLRGIGTLNMDGAKIAGGLTDKNIVSSINALQNKLDNLGEAISNMQLVLDSGALVGGTSSLMDQALGDISSHKGRAN